MAIDIEKYRQRLIEERDRLNEEIGPVTEVAGPATDDDALISSADAPVIDEVTDVQYAVLDMKSERLRNILTALQSMDDGTYGTCVECGKEIDPRRLDADPAVLTCIEDARKETSIATPSL